MITKDNEKKKLKTRGREMFWTWVSMIGVDPFWILGAGLQSPVEAGKIVRNMQ